MRCHGMSCSPCAGIMCCARSGHKAPVPDTPLGHVLRFAWPCVFGMGLSFRALFVPFSPPPAPPTAGPCFARILRPPAPGRGRAFRGGAVRAPDCACAPARAEAQAQDAPPPPPSQAFSRAGANGCGLRIPPPPGPYRQGVPLVNVFQGIFTKTKNKLFIRFRATGNGLRPVPMWPSGIASDAPLGYALLAYAESAKTGLSRAGRRSVAMIVEATESAAKETQ